MAGKLGVLTLDLIARIGQFVEPMKNAERQTKTSASNMARDFEEADKGISMSAKNIGLSLAGVAASYVSIDRLINTQRTFDKLNAGLITATGSAEGAAAAFDSLQKFAKETPYGLEQSVGAFIKLTNLGLKPSEAALTSYGNTAAAMGKDLDQMIEAVADATTGEFERLKEFGIKASQENGKVSLVFKGQTTTIKNNAKEIEKYLLNLGNVDFSGAMANRMNTLDGSIANLEDTVDGLFLKVSQSGIGDAIKTGVDSASSSLEIVGDNLDTVADLALVVGAIFAGKFSASMVGSVRKTIAASVEQKQALVAEQAANIQLLGIQAQRSRQNVALALTEVNLARADFNSATTAAARAAATQRLTAANIALAISEKQAVVSTSAYTVATAAATGATSRLAAAKALLLGLTGGWVGLGITVASVAAGYLMMKGGADESTKSLRENNESVEEAIKKYKELDEVKRRAQMVSEKDNLRDLAKEYDDITSKLITATYSFSRHNDMTIEQSKQVNALVAEYKKTGNIEDFSKKINALNFINQTSKDRFNTLGGSVKDAGDQFKNQKTFVDQMAPAVKGIGDEAKQTASEVAGLSVEVRKLLGINAEGASKSNYLKGMVDRKIDPKLAEMLYEARKASNLMGSGKPLDPKVFNSVMERWKAEKGLNKTLEERTKIEEKNKKAIEAQGNAMKVNALVASNAAKYNFAGIESKNKLPTGLLSAIHMQESKGDANAYNKSSGAAGGFQFLKPTADQYKVKNRNDLAQSAEAAGKHMAYLLKLFEGDLDKAISAYHAGEGNVQRGTNIGPVNRQYVKNIKGYMGGASGIPFNEDYSFDDWAKEQEKLVMEREKRENEQAEKQKQLALEVATYKERINTELADKIKEVNDAGFGEAETKRLTAEYQNRAAIDIQVSEASHTDKISEYSDYLKSEEQLLSESYARRQRDLKLDLTLTVDEYKKASLLLEGERDKELQKARWRALEIRQAMVDQIKGLSGGADEIFAQATMSPADYDRWSLENERSNAQVDLKNQRVGVEQDIMTSDSYSTDEDRYEALLEAHREYRDAMAAIDVDYNMQAKDLETQQYEDTMQMYGSMLSQAGTVWGSMTQMIKDSAGESSAAYKVMFLAQQAIAIAQGVVNTELAATGVMNDPSALTMAQKLMYAGVIRATGYASVGLIAAQTISGMAHDGIDNIPKEGTWLLDKGERVVDSRTNSDLKNYLAEGGGGGGDVHISVQVTDSGVSTQSNQSDQKQLGQMIGNAVRTVIRQEQRQGGLLSK